MGVRRQRGAIHGQGGMTGLESHGHLGRHYLAVLYVYHVLKLHEHGLRFGGFQIFMF